MSPNLYVPTAILIVSWFAPIAGALLYGYYLISFGLLIKRIKNEQKQQPPK
jgi:hypothetical protein